jgi:hypothetical protein
MIVNDAARDIADGLVSATFDGRSMTFVYEAGTPIMVNACIAWSRGVDEVVIFDGGRMAHRYKQTAPDLWDDELTGSEVRHVRLLRTGAQAEEGGGVTAPRPLFQGTTKRG